MGCQHHVSEVSVLLTLLGALEEFIRENGLLSGKILEVRPKGSSNKFSITPFSYGGFSNFCANLLHKDICTWW